MGGLFAPTQPTVVDTTGAAARPFAESAGSTLGGLTGGLAPALQNERQMAGVSQGQLVNTLQGQYMPGQARGNPFLDYLMGGLQRQGDVARRQLASSAQRAGALSGTDFLRESGNLEANLAERGGGLLSNLYEQERGRQMGAASALSGPWGVASAQTRSAESPFNLGMGLIGATRGQIAQPGPSPFASLLSAAAPFFRI